MFDTAFIFSGLGFLVACNFFGLIMFLFACGFIVIGLFDFCCMLNGINKRLLKEKNLVTDSSGLAWIWIAGLCLTLPMCALVYWCLDYPFDLIVATTSGMYTFTGTMAYAWTTAHLLLSYLLAFVAVFAVAWVIQTSKPGVFG